MEITNLPNKGVKIMAINTLTELGGKMDKHGKNFNQELKI